MPLGAGARVGPYEIVAPLGAGGMGEVFRARDTRLKREVALKILPDPFTADADRVARFQREAEVLAALSHSNIAAIYSLEIESGITGIAMELVEGETLAQRIARGPVPVVESIRIATQIAAALDAAHERGVVHRDLKPANIALTPNGDVKVLDFGLAKFADASEPTGSAAVSQSVAPTVTSPSIMTRIGAVLGTAAYMAPEQARGQGVDKRVDVWAFGCVWYEMLTGMQAFRGESVAESLSAVLHQEPDWSAVPAGVPGHIRGQLERCLTKDRRQRLRDIGDLRWNATDSAAAAPPATTAKWVAWGAAGMLAAVAAAGWMRASAGFTPQTPFALTVMPPIGQELSSLVQELSPDGSAVAFIAFNPRNQNERTVYVRRLDDLEPRPVPDSSTVNGNVAWSQDSSSVAFLTPRGLVKVRLPDGPPQLIGELETNIVPRGTSWSDTGTILITMPLMAVPAGGGPFRPISVPGLKPGQIQSPHFLPEGDDLLFLLLPEDGDEPEVYLGTLRGDTIENATLLFTNNTAVRYTPAGGGRVLFVRNDNLYAQRLDRSARRLDGDPQVIVRGVSSMPGNTFFHGYFSVSRTGTIAWKPGVADLAQVTIFDRRGEPLGTAGPASLITSIVLSPDETRLLAFSPGLASIVDVGQPGRVPMPRGVRWFGWSAEGARILGMRQSRTPYSQPPPGTQADAPPAFVHGSADGTSGLQTIAELSAPFLNPLDVSADATSVLGQNGDDIAVLRVEKNGAPVVRSLVDPAQSAYGARFSPDGRWVVFEDATEVSPGALYAQPVAGLGRRRQVTSLGQLPEWRRDGKEIVFRRGAELWSVPVTTSAGDLRFGEAVKLFSGFRMAAGSTVASRGLAISRDGSRVFAVQKIEQLEPNVLHVRTGALP